MQFVLLDSNGIRLEVNNRKIAEEFQSICRLNNRLLITHVKEEISMKLKTIFFTKCKSSVQFGHSVVSYALRWVIKSGPGNRGLSACGTTHQATSRIY